MAGDGGPALPTVPFYLHAKLRPCVTVWDVDELSHETGRAVQGWQFVERRWQQPPLIPVHVSKGEILVSLFNFPKVYAPAFLPVFETGPADAAALPSTRRRSTVPARLFQYA